MESQPVGELLMGEVRKFLHEAPAWTQLVSGCFYQATASEERSLAHPSTPQSPPLVIVRTHFPAEVLLGIGRKQANITAWWEECPQRHNWEFANQAPCVRHCCRFSLGIQRTRCLGEGGIWLWGLYHVLHPLHVWYLSYNPHPPQHRASAVMNPFHREANWHWGKGVCWVFNSQPSRKQSCDL